MGFFDRITNVFKGRASNAMSKLESANPEAVYEAAIIDRQKQYQEMKSAAAELAVVRKRSQDELDEKQRKLAEIDPMIQIAVQSGEEEAALVLLEEKEILVRQVLMERMDLTANLVCQDLLETEANLEKMEALVFKD